MLEYVLVLLVGFIVGTINGMAGGASLLSFPVLLAIGLNPVSATVTNSLGVSSANIFAWISNKQTGWEVFHKYKKIILEKVGINHYNDKVMEIVNTIFKLNKN